jgi:hypothetical protein
MTDMGSPLDSSPIVSTLHTILTAFGSASCVARKTPQPETEFLLLSYKDDFEYIWDLKRNIPGGIIEWVTSGGDSSTRTVVLVWDGVPPEQNYSTINMANYVTPYDWALALSCVASGDNFKVSDSAGSIPNLRILIFDLKSQENSGAFAGEVFPVLGHAMPWVRIYRPVRAEGAFPGVARTDEGSAISFSLNPSHLGSLDSESFLADVSAIESRVPSLRQERDDKALHMLTELWRTNMVRPGDRHHVGNLLAPMLLAQGLPDKLRTLAEKAINEASPLRRALMVLVEIIGLGRFTSLASQVGLPERGIVPAWTDKHKVFRQTNNLRVLLIDDQYRLGYQHILGYALFGELYAPEKVKEKRGVWRTRINAGRINCVASARYLFNALWRVAPVSKNWELPRVFPVSCDILMLDLRLWADEAGRSRFLRRLIKICDRLKAQEINDEKFQSALARAREISRLPAAPLEGGTAPTNGWRDTSEIEAVALMPLLLSHYDSSLPIILFSSTHQRTLLASVSHRPNIIVSFTKPILSGYGEDDTPARLALNLDKAFTSALELHESRPIWRRIVKTDWRSPPVFEIAWPTGDGKTTVYNSPVTSWPSEAQRTFGGLQQPKLKGKRLQATLADHYRHYIEDANYYDYASVPWEIIEGSLIPDKFLDSPFNSNPQFSLEPGLNARNHVVELLRHIRNKKTHGQAQSPSGSSDLRQYRLAALMAFMFFLDFLNNEAVTSDQGISRSLGELSAYLRMRYPHLRNRSKKPFKPRFLTADRRVSWLDFVSYTACYSAQAATSPDGATRFLSEKTLGAVRELSSLLWEEFWIVNRSRVPAGLKAGSRWAATVLAHDEGNIYVQMSSNSFYARMPTANSCRSSSGGDGIVVLVENLGSDIPLVSEDMSTSRLLISLDDPRTPSSSIAAWFEPAPQHISAPTRSKNTGRYFTRATFASHKDAHRALKSLPNDKKWKVRFAL